MWEVVNFSQKKKIRIKKKKNSSHRRRRQMKYNPKSWMNPRAKIKNKKKRRPNL